MTANRNPECRYCDRYDRPCGRDHAEFTRGDWARTWDGREAPLTAGDRARGRSAAGRLFAQSTAERNRFEF